MKNKTKSWLGTVFSYAGSEKKRLILSVVLSVLSVMLGLVPFYSMYRMICLFAAGATNVNAIVGWCLLSLLAHAVKILLFSQSTGVSHTMAYHVLESLRLRLADRFLHAPLGDVENHSIGEIKSMMVDKIEGIEPPLAHMIPEGVGHIVLPIVSIVTLAVIDWRLALASLVTFPVSFLCMGLTFKISGNSFNEYDRSGSAMNSAIVEYIEGIEVIKAFGRAGVSYEKYAGAITDFRTFVVKWLVSTMATMKLSFALFPSTLIGTLPVALALANGGVITVPQAALDVSGDIHMNGYNIHGHMGKLDGSMTDLNNVLTPGYYFAISASTAKHFPTTTIGLLEIFQPESYFIQQRYTIYNGSRIYIRTRYGGT